MMANPSGNCPKDWKEGPAKPMRFATILVPAEPSRSKSTVNLLSWPARPKDVLANVNRWRGQLQLPPTDAAQCHRKHTRSQSRRRPMTIVDLRGRSSRRRHDAAIRRRCCAVRRRRAGTLRLICRPVIHRSTRTHPHRQRRRTKHLRPPLQLPAFLRFTAPTDWKPLKVEAGGMRKAAFEVGDAEHNALVTVISFQTTEGPQIADPLQNVNMWRQDVGLADDQARRAQQIDRIDRDRRQTGDLRARRSRSGARQVNRKPS